MITGYMRLNRLDIITLFCLRLNKKVTTCSDDVIIIWEELEKCVESVEFRIKNMPDMVGPWLQGWSRERALGCRLGTWRLLRKTAQSGDKWWQGPWWSARNGLLINQWPTPPREKTI